MRSMTMLVPKRTAHAVVIISRVRKQDIHYRYRTLDSRATCVGVVAQHGKNRADCNLSRTSPVCRPFTRGVGEKG